jgi:hypothetical protein
LTDRKFPAKERQRTDEEIEFAQRHQRRPDPIPLQERGLRAWIKMMVARLDDINDHPLAREFWDAVAAWEEDWKTYAGAHPKHAARELAKSARDAREATAVQRAAQARPGAYKKKR